MKLNVRYGMEDNAMKLSKFLSDIVPQLQYILDEDGDMDIKTHAQTIESTGYDDVTSVRTCFDSEVNLECGGVDYFRIVLFE